MTAIYTDTPHNMAELAPYVILEKNIIVSEIFHNPKCYFYDTCSFRRHANLGNDEATYLMEYIKTQNGIVVITRCILMELASHSGVLNPEYIDYVRRLKEYGIIVLVVYEEDVFSIMEVCFSTNETINRYLCWAVRMIKSPVSTITETLENNTVLKNEVVKGRNIDNSGIYKRFFEAVRANKEAEDNLGEEMIAICLHILSHIPGEEAGKFCVITDDKGAAGKIDIMSKNAKQHNGKPIEILSTPKLVQFMCRENMLRDIEQIKRILGAGTNGRIVVLGARSCDIHSGEISLGRDELADLIVQPNAINILF